MRKESPLEKIKMTGLYFQFFEENELIGLGIFCTFDPKEERFNKEFNELVVGHNFCVGVHGYKSDIIESIDNYSFNEYEKASFTTISGKKYSVVSKVQPS